jgi:cell wall-associated NlpC family hydrolase
VALSTAIPGPDQSPNGTPITAPAQQGRTAPSAGLDTQGIVKAYENTSYTYGGPGGRTQGFGAPTDCSGFVAAVFKSQYGVDLVPHTDGAYNQLRGIGAPEVSVKDARPGDVVFYMGAGTGGRSRTIWGSTRVTARCSTTVSADRMASVCVTSGMPVST